MRIRLAVCLLVASLLQVHALSQTTSTTERVTRDWNLNPAIVSISSPEEVYALGDVHGDCDRLAQLLAAAKIIDSVPASPDSVRWTGGRAILVCTGDLIDKYNQSIRVIALMRSLQQQAAASGGRVIITLGNHEAEFLASAGQSEKASEFSDELTAAGISPKDVSLGRDPGGIGAWFRNLPAGAMIGDWFFCHAGNTGGLSLEDLSKRIEQQITAQGWGAPILADPDSMLEARMHPRPWWDWDGKKPKLKDIDTPDGEGNSAEELQLLKSVEALRAKHLVFGHQPGEVKFSDGTTRAQGQMYAKYHGLVFMIDTGMSRGVQSGRAALLRIRPIDEHPSATAIYIDGTTTLLWP